MTLKTSRNLFSNGGDEALTDGVGIGGVSERNSWKQPENPNSIP
jgi:hypothetical protein